MEDLKYIEGAPEGEIWTGTQILAKLDCVGEPFAHLTMDEWGWSYVTENGDSSWQCFEAILGYYFLPQKKQTKS